VEREAKEEKEVVEVLDSENVKSFVKLIMNGMPCIGITKITVTDTVATNTIGVATVVVEKETTTIPKSTTHTLFTNLLTILNNPNVIHPFIATVTTVVTNHLKIIVTKSVNTLAVDTTVAREEKAERVERVDTTEDTTVLVLMILCMMMLLLLVMTVMFVNVIFNNLMMLYSPVDTTEEASVEREVKVEREEKVAALDTKCVKQSVNQFTDRNNQCTPFHLLITGRFIIQYLLPVSISTTTTMI